MVYIKAFGVAYLVFGFLYGLYVFARGRDKWYMFPVNVLGGPIVVLYVAIMTYFFSDRKLG